MKIIQISNYFSLSLADCGKTNDYQTLINRKEITEYYIDSNYT